MSFSFGNLFGGSGSKSVLGIDIGTSSIKVVQLRKEKEKAILETYGELAIAPYADLSVGQATKLSEEKIIVAIKDVLKEANVTAKNASVSIPLKSSLVTVVSIPSFSEDIAETVQIEARKYIPVPLSEINLDWWVLPEREKEGASGAEELLHKEKERKFSTVLLVAIHKNTVSEYQRIFAKTDLAVKAYEVETFSMVRSSTGRENTPVAVLDFGASSVKLTIVDYGVIRYSHLIGKGSQDLTLVLSRSLNVDFGRAEEMKREIGLSVLPEHREMVAVMEPVLDFIFSEANSLIKDFQKKYQRSVGKVVLVGGGSMLKGMNNFAVKRLALNVELAEPFGKVEYPALLENVLRETGVDFAVAVGLALRIL